MRIGLVACSKTKLDRPAPARELYTSPLFRAASGYCERVYDRWYVLSALHGLVHPDQVIEPYDVTLATMTAEQRRGWRYRVRAQWGSRAPDLSPGLIFLQGGILYRKAFHPATRAPLAGLGIGQQLAWYAHRAADGVTASERRDELEV